jgi:signal transduction histidine kinase
VALRTASLQEALTQLEEFSYSVSHDLRSPMRAISGYACVLQEDPSDELPEEARQYLERISRSTLKMQRLVEDVLTISRIARTEIDLMPIPLQPLIEGIAEHYSELQDSTVDLSVATPHTVLGDAVSLQQALSNLLINAAKFVPKGVQLPVIRVRSEARDKRVRVWFEDNGIGIPLGERGKLFSMFERLPGGISYEGTGIGLAIVRKAVERIGGSVGVESDGKSGSQFWIELESPNP